MHVRPAQLEDARAIAHIQITTWRQAYQKIVAPHTLDGLSAESIAKTREDQIQAGMLKIWVACHGDQVVGYAIAGPPPDHNASYHTELLALYVLPSHVGSGVGRGLVSAVVHHLVKEGVTSLLIRAFRDNGPARRMYEDIGGQFLGHGVYELDGITYPDVSYGFSDLPRLLQMLVTAQVREVNDQDSIPEITALLHRAYARNAAAGLRFNACHQNDERTRLRLSEGAGLVMEREGRLVGTLALCLFENLPYGTFDPSGLVASFGQFAIEPELSRLNLGGLLIRKAEERARAAGATFLALDTAKPASGLVSYYQRQGFEMVGEVDYRPSTNYDSWVLAKRLT